MQMWRFRVVCASPGALLFHTIILRKNGQWVKEISGGLCRWSDGGDKQMIVALYPLDGALNTSDKLKTYVRIGGTKSSSIGDNPMKGRHALTTLSVANRQNDGSFLLMRSSGGGSDPAENPIQLVLKIYVSKTEGTPPPRDKSLTTVTGTQGRQETAMLIRVLQGACLPCDPEDSR